MRDCTARLPICSTRTFRGSGLEPRAPDAQAWLVPLHGKDLLPPPVRNHREHPSAGRAGRLRILQCPAALRVELPPYEPLQAARRPGEVRLLEGGGHDDLPAMPAIPLVPA